MKEQQEEIYRLQLQVGSSDQHSEVVIIPDPESIVKDIKDSVLSMCSDSDEKIDDSTKDVVSPVNENNDVVSPTSETVGNTTTSENENVVNTTGRKSH